MKSFISGSAGVTSLPSPVVQLLENLDESVEILVGDCRGADTLVQDHLKESKQKVTVYCSGSRCRNCLREDWEIKHIPAGGLTGRDFFTTKDIAMCNDCDGCLAIWDGKSEGTKRNIDMIKSQSKPLIVYPSK